MDELFKKQKKNLGIEVLRMILCFWVLCFHCLNQKKINYFLFFLTKTKFYHVPCFCFMSFYFSYKIFLLRDMNNCKKRIERLLIPYIIWPLIIFIINNYLLKKSIISFSVYQLIIQLILGRQFIVPFWYLFVIIFLTLLFFILSSLSKKNFIFIIQILGLFSYIVQYSNYYNFLEKYNSNVKGSIIGALFLLPLSVTGIIIAKSNIITIFKENVGKTLFFSY